MIINQTGGGGLQLNGVIEQHAVVDGKIEAGDFVKRIKGSLNVQSGNNAYGTNNGLSLVELTDDTIVVFVPGASNQGFYGRVVKNDGSNITIGTSTMVVSTTGVNGGGTVNAIKLNDTQIAVFYNDKASSSSDNYYLYSVIVSVSGTTLSAETPVWLETSTTMSSNHIKSTMLSDGRLAVAWSPSGAYIYLTVLTVSGTTLSKAYMTTVSSETHCQYGGLYIEEVAENTLLVLCNGGNSYYAYGKILVLGSDSATAGTLTSISSTYQSGGYFYSRKLDTGYVFCIRANGSNVRCGVMLSVNGTTITCGAASTTFNAYNGDGGLSVEFLDDETVFVLHSGYSSSDYRLCGITFKLLGDTVSVIEGPTVLIDEAASGKCAPFSRHYFDERMFAIHSIASGSSIYFAASYVVDGVMKATESPAYGVSAINGNLADEVDIYVPA